MVGNDLDGKNSINQLSKFTYGELKELTLLGEKIKTEADGSSWTYMQKKPCNGRHKLRIIVFIDLDAFYAQCEMVRLNVSPKVPLACQQWLGLIAVNYPARAYGISRHESAQEAKSKCPDLVLAHVPTWRVGDSTWAYHENPSIAYHKVSLDPYRKMSKKIFSIFKKSSNIIRKKSIDEAALDLTYKVFIEVISRYPILNDYENHNDDESLPLPPQEIPIDLITDRTTIFGLRKYEDSINVDNDGENKIDEKIKADKNDKDSSNNEKPIYTLYPGQVLDWDDVFVLTASKITSQIRNQILSNLGITCSAGISNNIMLSKMASGFHKPDHQTVLLRDSYKSFLADNFELRDIPGLKGKFGASCSNLFDVPEKNSIKHIRQFSLIELTTAFHDDDDTQKVMTKVQALYDMVRGIDYTEVNPHLDLNSMASCKNLRKGIFSIQEAEKWYKVLAADIISRINTSDYDIDTEALKSLRRPRTCSVHVSRPGFPYYTKQASFSLVKDLDKLQELLFNKACTILNEINDVPFPWSYISLDVSNFEDLASANIFSMDKFLVNKNENKRKIPASDKIANEKELTIKKDSNNLAPISSKSNSLTETSTIENNKKRMKNSKTSFKFEIEERIPCPVCKRLITISKIVEHVEIHNQEKESSATNDLCKSTAKVDAKETESKNFINIKPKGRQTDQKRKQSKNATKNKDTKSSQQTILNFIKPSKE